MKKVALNLGGLQKDKVALLAENHFGVVFLRVQGMDFSQKRYQE